MHHTPNSILSLQSLLFLAFPNPNPKPPHLLQCPDQRPIALHSNSSISRAEQHLPAVATEAPRRRPREEQLQGFQELLGIAWRGGRGHPKRPRIFGWEKGKTEAKVFSLKIFSFFGRQTKLFWNEKVAIKDVFVLVTAFLRKKMLLLGEEVRNVQSRWNNALLKIRLFISFPVLLLLWKKGPTKDNKEEKRRGKGRKREEWRGKKKRRKKKGRRTRSQKSSQHCCFSMFFPQFPSPPLLSLQHLSQ